MKREVIPFGPTAADRERWLDWSPPLVGYGGELWEKSADGSAEFHHLKLIPAVERPPSRTASSLLGSATR